MIMSKRLYVFLFLSFFLLIINAQEKNIYNIFSKSLEVVNEKNRKERFKGQILKGKRNGMGILAQNDGSLFVGDFYRDKISGYGMFIVPQGDSVENCDSSTVYIGNWQNGMKSGSGICYTNNGDIIYQGQFHENKPTGQYPSIDINKQKYFSCFDFGNGDFFIGEIEKGMPNGYGVLVFDNGDLWLGNFKDGEKNGVGLYLLYDGEWETLNFDNGDYNVISSSVNYRNIDANRKAIFRSSLSEAFGYFAEAANQAVKVADGVQSMKNGSVSSVTDISVNNDNGVSRSSVDNKSSSIEKSSSAPYSISANQSKNTDSRTYANYDGMLSKMRYGNMEYDDSKRREYQSKMKALRQKWEQRGERFQHSENEDWIGK